MFLKNKNIIFKIRRSKVTDYAALSVSTGYITKNIFVYQSQTIMKCLVQILGLLHTRCICDVSATYQRRLHDECAAYCNDQNNTAFNRILSANDNKSTP